MVQTPVVKVNLKGINENAKILKQTCLDRGIKLTGVVKGAAGDLEVMKAFINGGIESLGDSRLHNIIKFRQAGYQGEIVLLRLPQISEIEEVVKHVDISLVSELDTVRALSAAADNYNKSHGIIVMVDVGDLREGFLPEELEVFFDQIINLPAIDIKGLGTNVGCYGGVLPSRENTEMLVKLKVRLEKAFSVKFDIISGGNTATTILLEDNSLAPGINHLRIGEAILQGTDITNQRLVKGLQHYNFTLAAQVIELKEKPSVPIGEIGHDAFGNIPEYPDKGIRKRVILAVGRQDVKVDGLIPVLEKAEILGASSDHLIVDITDVDREFKIGDTMEFKLDYGAMLSVMTSPYVAKAYL